MAERPSGDIIPFKSNKALSEIKRKPEAKIVRVNSSADDDDDGDSVNYE